MSIVLHIFKKDIRCMWRQALVTLAALAVLTQADIWRWDSLPSPVEGVLNLLLPVAWFALAAMLVQQESLLSERQFWLAWPYRWTDLLAAKMLFVVAFIHVPYLLSNVAILAAHGFSPFEHSGTLLWKQAALAAVVTLPAIALATVTRNLLQFLPAAITLAVAAFLAAGGLRQMNLRLGPLDESRLALAGGMLLLISVAIVFIQYPFRRPMLSRLTGLAGLGCCVLFATMLPREKPALLPGAVSPIHRQPLVVEIDPQGETPQGWSRSPGNNVRNRLIFLPLRLVTGPAGISVQMELLRVRLSAPGGITFEVPLDDLHLLRYGQVLLENRKTGFLQFPLDRAIDDRLRDLPLSISIETQALVAADTSLLRMPALDGSAANPAIGHCRTFLTGIIQERRQLRVFCEAPERREFMAPVKLVNTGSGRTWRHMLNDGWTFVNYPVHTWLSPLQRSQTFFDLRGEGLVDWGDAMVPEELVPGSTVSILKVRVEDYGRIQIQGEGIILSRFRSLPPRL